MAPNTGVTELPASAFTPARVVNPRIHFYDGKRLPAPGRMTIVRISAKQMGRNARKNNPHTSRLGGHRVGRVGLMCRF